MSNQTDAASELSKVSPDNAPVYPSSSSDIPVLASDGSVVHLGMDGKKSNDFTDEEIHQAYLEMLEKKKPKDSEKNNL